MSTLENTESVWQRLRNPFPAEDIEWRVQRAGEKNGKPWAFVLAYVNARAIQDRLDDVVGADNWKTEYHYLNSGFICRLSIRLPMTDRSVLTKDGIASIRMNEWITKEDGAPETEIEPFKGGISGSLKRTASVWGIGRYLHNLDAAFAIILPDNAPNAKFHKDKTGLMFYWKPPALPAWAQPKPIAVVTSKSVPSVGESIAVKTTKEGPSFR